MPVTNADRIETKLLIKRDCRLIKETLKGDSRAFAMLMSLYKKRVEMLGMSFFKNHSDTEDFVQEVFLRAYTKLSTYKGNSLFSTWITRVAYNIAINSVNRRKDYVALTEENSPPDSDLTPEEKQIQKATFEAVHAAIEELPERFAICLDLYFFYDIPYQEISEITEIPVNTIKSHIFRAKQLLRDKLTKMHFSYNEMEA
ncbi:MAG: sigma-70 family RNA polymerase sigma factor [Treponema sp.]|nr:sigma-70 family RNA polymerase sigma factor [Treponema sp.]